MTVDFLEVERLTVGYGPVTAVDGVDFSVSQGEHVTLLGPSCPEARTVSIGGPLPVLLEQPQYQASELLIGVITHGYKVAEVPATIHRRRVGESKKGQNPLYRLHIPGVNNLFYGLRFARVAYGTWWRERQRTSREQRSANAERTEPANQAGSSGPSSGTAGSGPVESAARANGSGPGSVETSASSAAAGAARPADPAKRT